MEQPALIHGARQCCVMKEEWEPWTEKRISNAKQRGGMTRVQVERTWFGEWCVAMVIAEAGMGL